MVKPKETFSAVHDGRKPQLLMDIHSVSEVNDPSIDLSAINGPATSEVFNHPKQKA
jgi:NADH-quinone oxidoreductase subunit G